MLSLCGFAEALSGLTTGIIWIPSKFEKHHANVALEPSTFYWSMAFHAITGILCGLTAVLASRALFGKPTVRPPESPDEPTAQNNQASLD
jgi:H+/Cl- antiporter ClcA